MDSEKVYFDEEVNGHKLLVTSHIIAFKGKRFDAPAVDGVSASVYRSSVNAVPQSASYRVSIASQGDTISVDCAGWFWFGRQQYERLRSAVVESVGHRLIRDALQRLAAGESLVFEHKGSLLEKDSRFTLSRLGLQIEQRGVFSHKALMIEWRHLRMQNNNGNCSLQCYATKKRAAFQMWHMSNNIVLGAVLGFLLDKANYRLLDTPAA